MTTDPSLLRVGGAACIGVALASAASVVAAVSMPAELQARPDVTPHEFWLVLSRQPHAHLAYHVCWVVFGFFGLAAVPSLSMRVFADHRGAVLWSGIAGLYGFAVSARSHLMELAFDRKILATYAEEDAAFQQAVHVVAGLALDVPDGVLTYGAIGVWMLVVSVLALRHGRLPKLLCWVGIAAALASVAGVVGYAFLVRPLLVLSIAAGNLVLGPLFYAWAGVVLRREAAAPR